ncbi:MAG: hypothetical protein P1Q69_14645 [Candidatus Thorarchaeota archaeon]|nr:hypothetical protein [Candidatus Thorarchaeota archaeon]
MHRISDTTISKRNYRAVMFLFGYSSAILIIFMMIMVWQGLPLEMAAFAIVTNLAIASTLLMWFRRKYPPSARYD